MMAVCAILSVAVIGGCAERPATLRTATPPASVDVTAQGGSGTDTTPLASAAEVRRLLAWFNQPENPGDLGYELLGREHNDTLGWTRSVVLAHTDYGGLVRSMAAQQTGIPTAALVAFGRSLASNGTTATFDLVLNSQWRLENGGATKDDRALSTLIPASTLLGLLFDRQGRLLDTYDPRGLTVSGTVAEATYSKPGVPDVTLAFELARDASGGLRIAGWSNYAHVRDELRGNEIVDGWP